MRELLSNHRQNQVFPEFVGVGFGHSERPSASVFAVFIFPQGFNPISKLKQL